MTADELRRMGDFVAGLNELSRTHRVRIWLTRSPDQYIGIGPGEVEPDEYTVIQSYNGEHLRLDTENHG